MEIPRASRGLERKARPLRLAGTRHSRLNLTLGALNQNPFDKADLYGFWPGFIAFGKRNGEPEANFRALIQGIPLQI